MKRLLVEGKDTNIFPNYQILFSKNWIIGTDPVIPSFWAGLPAGLVLYRSCFIVLSVIRSLMVAKILTYSQTTKFYSLKMIIGTDPVIPLPPDIYIVNGKKKHIK